MYTKYSFDCLHVGKVCAHSVNFSMMCVGPSYTRSSSPILHDQSSKLCFVTSVGEVWKYTLTVTLLTLIFVLLTLDLFSYVVIHRWSRSWTHISKGMTTIISIGYASCVL